MSGLTAVYVTFAISLASIFGYIFLLSQRQKETEMEVNDLREQLSRRGDSR